MTENMRILQQIIMARIGILLIALLIVLPGTAYAQDTSWTVQSVPYPIGLLNGICFTDTNDGWAVGFNPVTDSAIIIHTTNGGEEWVRQEHPLEGMLTSVFFVNSDTGYTCGRDSNDRIALLKTTDGGQQWSRVILPAVEGFLDDLHFFSASRGCLIGNKKGVNPQVDPQHTIILHTDDGTIWNEVDHPVHMGWLNAVCFADTVHGWTVGEDDAGGPGIILQTDDGGESWIEQTSPASSEMFMDVFFINENTGWTIGNWNLSATVFKTNDGGTTWDVVSIFDGSYHSGSESIVMPGKLADSSASAKMITSCFFVNENDGFIAVNTKENSHFTVSLYKTTDSGTTFTKVTESLDNAWAQGMTVTGQKVYIVGTVGVNPLVAIANVQPGEPPELTTIEIEPSEATLEIGDQQQFTATGKDQFGNPVLIEHPYWHVNGGGTIEQEDIPRSYAATGINSSSLLNGTSCIFTANEAGDYTLTCIEEFKAWISGFAEIHITPPLPQLTQIVISPSQANMQVGQDQTFTAEGRDQNGDPMTIPDPNWTVNGGATLSPAGSSCITTATGTGDYTLTCRSDQFDVEGSASLHITAAPTLTQIVISPSQANMQVGQDQTFTAEGRDQNGDPMTIPNPNWEVNGGGTISSDFTNCTFHATDSGGPYNLTCRDDSSGISGTAIIYVYEVLFGDVNCDSTITPGDALCAFWRAILGTFQEECECDFSDSAADVNCDGAITPGDALCIFWRSILGDWTEECRCEP